MLGKPSSQELKSQNDIEAQIRKQGFEGYVRSLVALDRPSINIVAQIMVRHVQRTSPATLEPKRELINTKEWRDLKDLYNASSGVQKNFYYALLTIRSMLGIEATTLNRKRVILPTHNFDSKAAKNVRIRR